MINDSLIKLRLLLNVLRLDTQSITMETYVYLKNCIENTPITKSKCNFLNVAFIILKSEGCIDIATHKRLFELLYEVKHINLENIKLNKQNYD